MRSMLLESMAVCFFLTSLAFPNEERNAPQEAIIDILPGICPNTISPMGEGAFPVAILDSREFSVRDIDRRSVRLQTSDSGGSVVPLRSFFRDIATPLPSESCECHNPVSDGIEDLIFNFDLTEIIEALNLLSFPNQTIRLKLIGRMVENGGPADFIGVDCVQIPDN